MSHLLSSFSPDIVQAETVLRQPQPDRLFIEARLGTDPDDEYRLYREGHILGAVHAQIRDVFAAPPDSGTGNLPLPDPAVLQETLRRWQVSSETEVIVYGPSAALAARAWWTLRWAGLSRVRLLDGGLKSWVSAGGPVAQGDYVPPAREDAQLLVLKPGQLEQIHVADMERLPPDVIVLDARDEAAYLAGHIPCARSLPAAELWTPGGTFRTVSEIRRLYEQVGVGEQTEPVVYCGGGVLSALHVLALRALGISSRLYVGSWSEWNKSSARMARSAVDKVLP